MATVNVAVLGAGTVGSQVIRLIEEQGRDLRARAGAELNLQSVVVRDVSAPRDAEIDPALLTTDAQAAIDSADLVIELIGGIEPPRTLVLDALRKGKTVVTGNKALIAAHGPELHEAATAGGADLYYEAAVAGAVPVVYGLRESMVGDKILRVLGIVNGTTNFILDAMTQTGASYEDALAEAQRLGFAEADPTADVEGLDAAAKCAILASLAFHTRVSIEDVAVEGISKITADDIAEAEAGGNVIKLLAIAERITQEDGSEGISVRVHPTLVPRDHTLANVHGPFNAIVVDGESAGRLMFYGQGAGGAPTATAVLSDVVAAASHIAHGGNAPCELVYANLPVLDASVAVTRYQVQLKIADRAGVLAEVAGVFADNGISIKSVNQKDASEGSEDGSREEGGTAVLTILTHRATEGALATVVKQLAAADSVREVASILRSEVSA
ncbi:homoserine dehydrogenase [Actinomyces minihominis]|uniref:homoserine dehydrogenase n=1 Tax=Actinomyces minihominis TaxID=2002838 RepID=UPI000C086F35|nr:homoserine dehydrogenase [Actinomyces minihominis]